MSEETLAQWQNSYSVGIKLVDEQHMELINLTNKLYASCRTGKQSSINTFLDVVHDAVDYTGYHFSTEEKIMARVNYPGFPEHKKEHTDFVREVFIRVEEYKAGKSFAPLQFVYFLRDWIVHHIAVSDKKMGDYLIGLKRNGELHKITLRVKKNEASNRVQIQ